MPPKAAFFQSVLLLAFLVFALLIGNAAAGLASGLARGLAFTATAVLGAFAKILGFEGFNVFHIQTPSQKCYLIIARTFSKVNVGMKKNGDFS